jgi:hypothetical protein
MSHPKPNHGHARSRYLKPLLQDRDEMLHHHRKLAFMLHRVELRPDAIGHDHRTLRRHINLVDVHSIATIDRELA